MEPAGTEAGVPRQNEPLSDSGPGLTCYLGQEDLWNLDISYVRESTQDWREFPGATEVFALDSPREKWKKGRESCKRLPREANSQMGQAKG